jgi:replicative DNA helicase
MNRERVIDAEGAVLGAMMIDPRAYFRVADIVSADDFATGQHRRLFDVIEQQAKSGGDPDAVTIGEISPDLAGLAVELASVTPGAANITAYAEIVARHAMERRVIQAGQRIAKLSGADAYAEARAILDACQPRSLQSVVTLKSAMRDWFSDVSAKAEAETETELTGLPTSIPWLDEQTGGLQPGNLIIVAARPSVGKTLLGLQIALHAGLEGQAGMFFSLEMSAQQLADRAVSALGKVSTHALRRPKSMTDEDWSAITTGVTRGSPLPLWIDDSSGVTASDVAARSIQQNATRRLSCIVVDYLGLMRHPRADRHDLAIGQTTAALKALAKRLQVPVILLAQLNRDGDNARPTMRMLRDSGSIEQDADVIVFLHRPSEENWSQIELILAKQRSGPTGSTWLYGDYSHMWFKPGEAPDRTEPPPPKPRGYRSSGADRRAGS